MNNTELMQRIKLVYGALDTVQNHFTGAIADAVKGSAIPASFMAALIANESTGDTHVKRFEKSTLSGIWEVLLGRKPSFGSIPRIAIVAYVAQVETPPTTARIILPANALQRIDELCTSHGLTQVMGYHILETDLPPAADTDALSQPPITLKYTTALLEQFAHRFGLDERKDFEPLLRCWNAGHPTGQTFDPNYVPNGLARMKLYEALT